MKFRRTEGIHAILLLGTALLVSCSTNRSQAYKAENSIPTEAAVTSDTTNLTPVPKSAGTLPGSRDLEKGLESLLRDSDLLFARGKALFENGEYSRGQIYFREGLNLLRTSGFSFEDYPEVEQAYRDLLSDIRRMEISRLAVPEEPAFPLLEELSDAASPLDEIGDVNLIAVEVDPELEDLVDRDLKEAEFDFPVLVNKEVLKFLDYYQGRGRDATEEALKRSGRYLSRFRAIFAEVGVPQDLVYMAHVESLFKTSAYSRAKARGIWQFVKGTAELYDLKVGWWLDERLDIEKATRSAAEHLKDLYEEFGDWYLALAAYNGGPGRVRGPLRRYGELTYWEMAERRLLPRETRNYVPSILAAMLIYHNPERYGFEVEPEPILVYEQVSLEYQVDLGVIAESLDVPLTTMIALNPELQRGVTPFETGGYLLKVPVGKGDLVSQKLAEIPPDQRLRLKHHKVTSGETLSHIAARYNVSILAIADVNRIGNINRLRLGQDLIIPLSEWKGSSGGVTGERDAEKHTVRRGDSLYEIAKYYGVSLEELFRLNRLEPTDYIHPGQEILLRSAE